jgi:undecaprenyl-diphosphatase
MDFLLRLDLAAEHWFEPIHNERLNDVMRALTHLGDNRVLAWVAAVAALAFALRGRARTGLILALTTLASFSLTEGTKAVVRRERPQLVWVMVERPGSPSFPSGHALESTAVYGGLGLLAARTLRRRGVRVLLIASGFGLGFLIGVTRTYLGVHYLTDILAGWDAGVALALLAYWADQRWGRRAAVRPGEAVAAAGTSGARLARRQDEEGVWAHGDQGSAR